MWSIGLRAVDQHAHIGLIPGNLELIVIKPVEAMDHRYLGFMFIKVRCDMKNTKVYNRTIGFSFQQTLLQAFFQSSMYNSKSVILQNTATF